MAQGKFSGTSSNCIKPTEATLFDGRVNRDVRTRVPSALVGCWGYTWRKRI